MEKFLKRKIYSSEVERRRDRLIGFLAFPAINFILSQFIESSLRDLIRFLFQDTPVQETLRNGLSLLPWVINGIILLLAFFFRVEFALGYIAFVAATITSVALIGALFLAGCFLLILSPYMGDISEVLCWLFPVIMIGLGIIGYLLVRYMWPVGNEKRGKE